MCMNQINNNNSIQILCELSDDRLNFLKSSELRIRNGRLLFPGLLIVVL